MSYKKADVIIIGAGVAGLSAGCYAQMNGDHTCIFEMHNLPGGLCTAWERKGYTFEGCRQVGRHRHADHTLRLLAAHLWADDL